MQTTNSICDVAVPFEVFDYPPDANTEWYLRFGGFFGVFFSSAGMLVMIGPPDANHEWYPIGRPIFGSLSISLICSSDQTV